MRWAPAKRFNCSDGMSQVVRPRGAARRPLSRVVKKFRCVRWPRYSVWKRRGSVAQAISKKRDSGTRTSKEAIGKRSEI